MSNDREVDEKLEELKAKQEKVRRLTSLAAGMTSSIAVVITIAMATGLFLDTTKTLSKKDLIARVAEVSQSNVQQLLDIKTLKNEIGKIREGLNSISSLSKESQWKIEASRLANQVNEVATRLSALESALTVDPSKALAVPILRKDLDNAEKSLRAELTQTKSEIDRIYDQNKWFIGLMFTIALSVLGMAVSSAFNRKNT